MIHLKNINLVLGGLFGATAVALSAYATHALHDALSAHDFESLTMAIHYQQLHALLLIALGLSTLNIRLTKIASIFIICGVFLFSGSIYAAILINMHAPIPLAPLGGISLMAGWLTLALTGFGKKSC